MASSLGTSDCCENLECRYRNDVGWKVVATTFHPMSLLHRHSWFSDSVSKHSYFSIHTQASSLYLHFLTASLCTFYHIYATRILVCVIAVACKLENFLLKVRGLFTFFVDDDATVFTWMHHNFFENDTRIQSRCFFQDVGHYFVHITGKYSHSTVLYISHLLLK